MSPVKVSYYSDVLCIWAYAAQRRLDQLAQKFGSKISAVVDRAEAEKALHMLPLKYPEQVSSPTPTPMPMPTPDDVRIFRVRPTIISVLDYSKGFGHTDLVTC